MTLSEMRIIFQGMSVLLIISTMIIEIKQLTISRNNIGYILAFTIWLLHSLIFYIFVFLDFFGVYYIYDKIPSNTWSSGLRFHGFVTILCVELSRLQTLKLKKEGLGG